MERDHRNKGNRIHPQYTKITYEKTNTKLRGKYLRVLYLEDCIVRLRELDTKNFERKYLESF